MRCLLPICDQTKTFPRVYPTLPTPTFWSGGFSPPRNGRRSGEREHAARFLEPLEEPRAVAPHPVPDELPVVPEDQVERGVPEHTGRTEGKASWMRRCVARTDW